MENRGGFFGASPELLLVALTAFWLPFFPRAPYVLAVSLVALASAFSFRRKWAHLPAIVLSSAVFFAFAGGFAPGTPFFADWPMVYGKIGKFSGGFLSGDISAVDLRIAPPSGIIEGAEPLHFALSALFASGEALSPGLFPHILLRLAIFMAFLALPVAIYVVSGGSEAGFLSAILASVLGPNIYFLNGNLGLHLATALGVVALRIRGPDWRASVQRLACFAPMLFLHKGIFLSAALLFSVGSAISGKFRKNLLIILAIALMGTFALALELSSHSYWEGYSSFNEGAKGVIQESVASRQEHLSDYFANSSWIFLIAYLPIFALGVAGLLLRPRSGSGTDRGKWKGLAIASVILASVSSLAGYFDFPWAGTARLFLGYSSIPLMLFLLASFSGEIVSKESALAVPVLAVFILAGAAYFQGFSDSESYGGIYSYSFSRTHGTGKFFSPLAGNPPSEALEVPFWISENYEAGGGADFQRFFLSPHDQFGGGFSLYIAPLIAKRSAFSGYGYMSPREFRPTDSDLKKECSTVVVSDFPCQSGTVLKEEGGVAFCDKGFSCNSPCSFSFSGNGTYSVQCPAGRILLPYSYVRGIVFSADGEAEISLARGGEEAGYYADLGTGGSFQLSARDSRPLPLAILAVGTLFLLVAPFFLIY